VLVASPGLLCTEYIRKGDKSTLRAQPCPSTMADWQTRSNPVHADWHLWQVQTSCHSGSSPMAGGVSCVKWAWSSALSPHSHSHHLFCACLQMHYWTRDRDDDAVGATRRGNLKLPAADLPPHIRRRYLRLTLWIGWSIPAAKWRKVLRLGRSQTANFRGRIQ